MARICQGFYRVENLMKLENKILSLLPNYSQLWNFGARLAVRAADHDVVENESCCFN